MKKEIAKQIVAMVNEHNYALDRALAEAIKRGEHEQDIKRFKLAVGHVLADSMDGVLAPIFAEHRELAPEWFWQ